MTIDNKWLKDWSCETARKKFISDPSRNALSHAQHPVSCMTPKRSKYKESWSTSGFGPNETWAITWVSTGEEEEEDE